MNDDTRAFLACLWPDPQAGYLTFTAVHPDKSKPSPSRHILITDHAQLALALHDLSRANERGWHAFVAIALRQANLGRWKRGGYADLLMLPALFADIDRSPVYVLPRLSRLKQLPSIVIGSGRGTHAYWVLQQPTTEFQAANRIIRWLTKALDGDRLTVANSMRLPGSLNVKDLDNPTACEIIDINPDRRYELDDFPRAILTHKQHSSTRRRLNPDLIMAICNILVKDYAAYTRPNGWIAALCPLRHARDEPGKHFQFSIELGMGHCFGKHGRLLIKDLCKIFKIDPSVYGGILI